MVASDSLARHRKSVKKTPKIAIAVDGGKGQNCPFIGFGQCVCVWDALGNGRSLAHCVIRVAPLVRYNPKTMASLKSIFPFFDKPPFSFFVDRLVEDEDFRNDLRKVLAMPQPQFDILAKSLADHPGFLDKPAFARIVTASVLTAAPKEITRTVWQINRLMRQSAAEPLEESLEALQNELDEYETGDKSKAFSETETKLLRSRLRALIVAPIGLAKQQKAETLADATAGALTNIIIVSDIRPVLDDEQKQVDGVVNTMTMRLEVTGASGFLSVIECRLTEAQLDKLCKVAEDARKRLATIKDVLATKAIRVALVAGREGDGE